MRGGTADGAEAAVAPLERGVVVVAVVGGVGGAQPVAAPRVVERRRTLGAAHGAFQRLEQVGRQAAGPALQQLLPQRPFLAEKRIKTNRSINQSTNQ